MPASPFATGRSIDSVSRRIAARTLDGYKVCAKLSLYFPQALSESTADETMSSYAKAFAESLENEICDGRLPFDEAAQHGRVTARIRILPSHRVRVTELHIARESPGGTQAHSAPPLSGPVSRPSPALASAAPPARTVSGIGVVRSRTRRTRPGFAVCLEKNPQQSAPEIGQVLSEPFRDATASLIFAALSATHELVHDPLRLLDGAADSPLRRSLLNEAATCVAYLLIDALTDVRIPQRLAVAVTEGATRGALAGAAVAGSDISRYLAIENATHELTTRFSALLELEETPDLEQFLGFALHSLRADLKLCAERLRERLLAGR